MFSQHQQGGPEITEEAAPMIPTHLGQLCACLCSAPKSSQRSFFVIVAVAPHLLSTLSSQVAFVLKLDGLGVGGCCLGSCHTIWASLCVLAAPLLLWLPVNSVEEAEKKWLNCLGLCHASGKAG